MGGLSSLFIHEIGGVVLFLLIIYLFHGYV